MNGGECLISQTGSEYCYCPDSWTGPSCRTKIAHSKCANSTTVCYNGGSCENG